MAQSKLKAWGSLTCSGKFLTRRKVVGTSGEEVLWGQGACVQEF